METYIKLTDENYDGEGHDISCLICVSGGDISIPKAIEYANNAVREMKADKTVYESAEGLGLIIKVFEEQGFTVKDCTPSFYMTF